MAAVAYYNLEIDFVFFLSLKAAEKFCQNGKNMDWLCGEPDEVLARAKPHAS